MKTEEMSIEQLKRDLANTEGRVNELRQVIAEHYCPFVVGDIIENKKDMRVFLVREIQPYYGSGWKCRTSPLTKKQVFSKSSRAVYSYFIEENYGYSKIGHIEPDQWDKPWVNQEKETG